MSCVIFRAVRTFEIDQHIVSVFCMVLELCEDFISLGTQGAVVFGLAFMYI